MIKQNKFNENEHFLLQPNIRLQSNRGTKYTFTPKAFFIQLVKSTVIKDYAIYYFHVLEIYDYYDSYFTAMYKKDIIHRLFSN